MTPAVADVHWNAVEEDTMMPPRGLQHLTAAHTHRDTGGRVGGRDWHRSGWARGWRRYRPRQPMRSDTGPRTACSGLPLAYHDVIVPREPMKSPNASPGDRAGGKATCQPERSPEKKRHEKRHCCSEAAAVNGRRSGQRQLCAPCVRCRRQRRTRLLATRHLRIARPADVFSRPRFFFC